MNEKLQSLHGTANDALVRLLFERVRDMRGSASDISQAVEKLAGRAPVPTDAPEQADERADSGRDQEPIA